MVEFDIFVGQGDNLVVGHATSFVELSVSHYSLIGDITSSFCFRYCWDVYVATGLPADAIAWRSSSPAQIAARNDHVPADDIEAIF